MKRKEVYKELLNIKKDSKKFIKDGEDIKVKLTPYGWRHTYAKNSINQKLKNVDVQYKKGRKC